MDFLRRNCAVLIVCLAVFSCCGAQDARRHVFTFSGTVFEDECAKLPLPSFEIGPSGDRWKSEDRLEVKCSPWQAGPYATLSLTFTIVGQILPTPPEGARAYTFRWGKAIGRPPSSTVGQFTYHPRDCDLIASLFTKKVSQSPTFASDELIRPPVLSVTCNSDDWWVTSMEIVLAANIQNSP
jgi:hypothetical protein